MLTVNIVLKEGTKLLHKQTNLFTILEIGSQQMPMSKQNIFSVHACLILKQQTRWKSNLLTYKPLLCVRVRAHACVCA